eukprot:3000663-Amphidinium_carterae.1
MHMHAHFGAQFSSNRSTTTLPGCTVCNRQQRASGALCLQGIIILLWRPSWEHKSQHLTAIAMMALVRLHGAVQNYSNIIGLAADTGQKSEHKNNYKLSHHHP